jgi:hypothetical protein
VSIVIGGAHIELQKENRVMYAVLVNGKVVVKARGQEAAHESYHTQAREQARIAQNITAPAGNLRRDVAAIVAAAVQHNTRQWAEEHGITPGQVERTEALRQVQAIYKDIRLAVRQSATTYAIARATRDEPLPIEERRHIIQMKPSDFWRGPKNWKGFIGKIDRYALRVVENYLTEGSVNQAWSR